MAILSSSVNKYQCTGRVHPERADISFSRIEMSFGDAGRIVASCEASQLTVTLDVPTLDGWIAAYILAEDIASIAVGALGFSLGSGYTVEIIQVVGTDDVPHVFGVRPSDESGKTLAFEPNAPTVARAFHLSVRDVFFRLAVRDYLRAINEVTDCALYCYRAIEGVKAGVCQRLGGDSWETMHSALKTERATITTAIKDFADPIRHGDWLDMRPTTRRQRWDMLLLTRDVLARYMEFLEQPSKER